MRKLLIISTLALLSLSVMGQIDTVNVGTGANTGTGDPLRSAFLKVNVGLNLLNSTHIYTITGTSDTVATKAYARLVGSAMSYPGSGIPLSTGSAWGTSITNNSVNWDTAYAARLRWSGTATGLTAATGRTSLGGTTVGQAFFTLANPSAITFPRMNADNTVTALSAANFKTALSLTSSDVGLGNVTNESKAIMFTSPAFTGSVPTSGGIPLGRTTSITGTFTAGVLTDITLTGITTKPYHIMIQTTAGKDITSAVSDSLGISGGTYHLYVYSVDLITDAEIKVTH